MQAYNKTMYTYGDEAPCYSTPRMLEEALGVDLRSNISNYDNSDYKQHFILATDVMDLKTGSIPSKMLMAVLSSDIMASISRELNQWKILMIWPRLVLMSFE